MKTRDSLATRASKIVLAAVVALSCLGIASVTALASAHETSNQAYADEWKKSGNRWWYQTGSSYATGWKQIGRKWEYSNGLQLDRGPA